jgi:hypothetical protein
MKWEVFLKSVQLYWTRLYKSKKALRKQPDTASTIFSIYSTEAHTIPTYTSVYIYTYVCIYILYMWSF